MLMKLKIYCITNHHARQGDGLAELFLYELGHEGGEASQQRCLVNLSQDHQQIDGGPDHLQCNLRKT